MSTIMKLCPEVPDVLRASEHAHAIVQRIVERLEKDDRINGTLSQANLDGLAEAIEPILSTPQRYESPAAAMVRS